jgi:hypothetical protein
MPYGHLDVHGKESVIYNTLLSDDIRMLGTCLLLLSSMIWDLFCMTTIWYSFRNIAIRTLVAWYLFECTHWLTARFVVVSARNLKVGHLLSNSTCWIIRYREMKSFPRWILVFAFASVRRNSVVEATIMLARIPLLTTSLPCK